jgi:hypothetical protein
MSILSEALASPMPSGRARLQWFLGSDQTGAMRAAIVSDAGPSSARVYAEHEIGFRWGQIDRLRAIFTRNLSGLSYVDQALNRLSGRGTSMTHENPEDVSRPESHGRSWPRLSHWQPLIAAIIAAVGAVAAALIAVIPLFSDGKSIALPGTPTATASATSAIPTRTKSKSPETVAPRPTATTRPTNQEPPCDVERIPLPPGNGKKGKAWDDGGTTGWWRFCIVPDGSEVQATFQILCRRNGTILCYADRTIRLIEKRSGLADKTVSHYSDRHEVRIDNDEPVSPPPASCKPGASYELRVRVEINIPDYPSSPKSPVKKRTYSRKYVC